MRWRREGERKREQGNEGPGSSLHMFLLSAPTQVYRTFRWFGGESVGSQQVVNAPSGS